MLSLTSPDILGPFHKDGAPFRNTLSDSPNLHLTGQVLNIGGEAVEGAILDIWHADADGNYDNEGYKLRGKILVGKDGKYALHTIVPGNYAISEDEFRCPHIHVKISARGYKELTTQVYFADNEYNLTDNWFNANRVINPDGTFDFVIEKLIKCMWAYHATTKSKLNSIKDKGLIAGYSTHRQKADVLYEHCKKGVFCWETEEQAKKYMSYCRNNNIIVRFLVNEKDTIKDQAIKEGAFYYPDIVDPLLIQFKEDDWIDLIS